MTPKPKPPSSTPTEAATPATPVARGPAPAPVMPENPVPCRHLRHKGMYVYTDSGGHGNHGVAVDSYDNTIFWCGKTLKPFGPDDDLVTGEDCHDTHRTCHDPL